MKKIFLILTLTAIMSVGLYAGEKGDSFVNAMGMGTAATGGGDSTGTGGDTGTGGSGVGGATVMNSIAAGIATSTVTTATPYSYNN